MAQGDVPRTEGKGTGEGARRESILQLVQKRGRLSPEETALFRDVFPEIVAAHHDYLWSRLLRRGLPDAEVEDIFQEACLGFYAYTVEHGFPDEIEAYLWLQARRRFVDHFRARRRSRESLGLPSSGSEKPPSAPDVDLALDLHGVAQRILPLLSPEHRDVIEVVLLGCLTHCEAAEVLDLPEGTVKSRLIAAKEAFRAHAELLLPPSQRGTR